MVALSSTSPRTLLAWARAAMVRRSSVEWRALYQLIMSASWEQRTTRLCKRSGEWSSRLLGSVEGSGVCGSGGGGGEFDFYS